MYNNPYLMGYNPQILAQQQQRLNMLEQQYPQFSQQNTQQFSAQTPQFTQPSIGLQGKSVASIDVVKAIDIPLDGSISYFPITDGSAIITKQLQLDGTSKTIIYKPVPAEEVEQEQPKYVTIAEVEDMLKTDPKEIKDIKEDIKAIKRQLRDLSDDIKGKE